MQRQSKPSAVIVSILSLGLLGLLGWVTGAQSDMADKRRLIAERQELMKNTAANFKDMSQKARDGQIARMMVNAHTIAINARHIPLLFPQGSMGTEEIESRAKADIWQDWPGFTTAAKNAQDAAKALLELTQNAETMAVSQDRIGAALKTLGEACKNCHKQFRQPKERE